MESSIPAAAEPTAEELEAMYETACRLCDEDDFRFAAALALDLTTHRPTEPRFGFLAGTCLQRIGQYEDAARFFCFALTQGGDNPAALFRLGECLLATGDLENADRAFDAALDVSRDVEGAEEVQHEARQVLDAIKSGSLLAI